ncbi:MAG: HPr family phosphocarrier protein [Propionibacteriaceae bacterium]|nr:HPr family phosphocarrier protein [Propionibacteriaceae bacterium]
MIGIVVVSHSRAVAQAAVDFASQLAPADQRPVIAVAAGSDNQALGATVPDIVAALEAADSPDGVVVLVDLGSAVDTVAEAVSRLAVAIANHTVITPAPLFEGLVAAVATAATGADLATVVAAANASLTSKTKQLATTDETDDPAALPAPVTPAEAQSLTLTITNEHGLQLRQAATLVAGLRGLEADVQLTNDTLGRGPAPASSLAGVAALGLRQGQTLSATITGPEAAVALGTIRYLAEAGFGEETGDDPIAETDGEVTDHNHSGRQIAVGPARHFSTMVDTKAYQPGDVATERARLDRAVNSVLGRLNAQAQLPGRQATVFSAQAILLKDPELTEALHDGLDNGRSAVAVVQGDFSALAAELAALDDPYLRERSHDITSLARQIIAELMGVQLNPGRVDGVLIVDQLDPLTAVTLSPERCLGVITCSGGATGHGVLIATARGIPVVTDKPEAAAIDVNTVVGLDPVQGRIWVNPTMADLAELERLAMERRNEVTLAAELCHQPALTSQGQRILVEANISNLTDARTAAGNGADGSGLVRTEALFADWNHAPSAEEQAAVFQQIARGLDGRMLTIRTWDVGGDKLLPWLPGTAEANPMLGERGLRALRRHPDLLIDQLTAIALTSRRTPVRVMFPMVTEVAEVRWAVDVLNQVLAKTRGNVAVGVMIETPAAALRAADFTSLVDFISIGTNDLTQYTMAADRTNTAVSHLTQGGPEAVWDLIALAAQAFAGRPVAVCGDLAGDPDLASRFVSLGVTELSVRPALVGLVKLAVRTRT